MDIEELKSVAGKRSTLTQTCIILRPYSFPAFSQVKGASSDANRRKL